MFSPFSTTTAPSTALVLSSASQAVDNRKREIYMCVPAVRGPLEKSVEEQRVEDYLRSYSTTNMPPQPVPQDPKDEQARAALGLQPLFQPHNEIIGAASPSSSREGINSGLDTASGSGNGVAGAGAHIQSPAQLPDKQSFSWVRAEAEKARFMSISCLYTFFSHEELRCYAYLKGNKYPPPGPDPIIIPPPVIASDSPAFSIFDPQSAEKWQSITCRPEFSKHSFEELRISYLSVGRELNSDEIIQYGKSGVSFAASPPAFGTQGGNSLFGGGIFGTQTIRPF